MAKRAAEEIKLTEGIQNKKGKTEMARERAAFWPSAPRFTNGFVNYLKNAPLIAEFAPLLTVTLMVTCPERVQMT